MTTRTFDYAKVQRLRNERHLSQDALATRSGLTTDGIRKVEQGRRTPRADTLVRLADALGIKTDELFR